MAETVDKQKDTGTTDLEHSFPVPMTLIQLVMNDNIFIVMASAPAMNTANSIVLFVIIAGHMVCN